MPRQDRTGTKYERLLASSLEALGFERNTDAKKNYLQPPKRSEIVIPGTYIQPDIVVREVDKIRAILYSTHWSNTRDSKRKFWRTWEEQAQQRCELGDDFVAVNCVFEALPAGHAPFLAITSDDLPMDSSRNGACPIQLEGWDPGIGWALMESFDANLVFPKPYAPVSQVIDFEAGDHDTATTVLLEAALKRSTKSYFESMWSKVQLVKARATKVKRGHPDTASRYRIGLLHIYLLVRLCELQSGKIFPLKRLVEALAEIASAEIDIKKLHSISPFDDFCEAELETLIRALAGVYVRKGDNPEYFCTIKSLTHCGNRLLKVAFNSDLRICVADLEKHLQDPKFESAIEKSFKRFDSAFGVGEALADLANLELVEKKANFASARLLPAVTNPTELAVVLRELRDSASKQRGLISGHIQNWHFEMLLYLCGLNSSEDIQTRFKERFEATGHKLRLHAPYGDHAKTVAFMIQGRDVCELWSETGRSRTLSKEEFRALCWEAAAKCVVDAIADYEGSHRFRTAAEAATLYLQSKSMRIISSDLNGFNIMIEHFLGDLCHLKFLGEDESDDGAANALSARVCPSWQTDMVKSLWGSTPLETWVEGVSKDGKWLIKAQSSQDGNEGHKTKELAGRSRAMHLKWIPSRDPTEREKWEFAERSMQKTALVLDGDWNRARKKNLYEAGWDWVGDVSELAELRRLISGGT